MEYINTKTNEFYNFSELKAAFENLRVDGFTRNFTVKDWNPDFAQIVQEPVPGTGHYHKAIRDGNTLKDGVYYQKWSVVEMTDEEKEQVDEWENRNQRELRNGRLTETDWTQLPDCPLTKEKVIEFREYRKYLRDLPTKNGWPPTHQVPGPPKISED